MKKTSLAFATAGLFVLALLFSISSDSKGDLHFFKKANASNLTYSLQSFPCPGGGTQLICGPGSLTTCTPVVCGTKIP